MEEALGELDTLYPYGSVLVCEDSISYGSVLFCEDSIFKAPEQSELPYHKSLFTGHELQVKHRDALARTSTDDGGFVFAVCVVLTILMLIFTILRRLTVKNVLLSSFSDRHMNVLIRDSGVKNDLSLFAIPLIYYASLGTAAYVALHDMLGEQIYGYADMALFTGLLLLFSFLRHMLIKMLGVACDERETVKLYTVAANLFQMIGTTLVIPATVMAGYVDVVFVWVVVAIVGAVFVMRLGRGLAMVMSRSRGSKLYLFYYLCIVEVVPILIVIKLISQL